MTVGVSLLAQELVCVGLTCRPLRCGGGQKEGAGLAGSRIRNLSQGRVWVCFGWSHGLQGRKAVMSMLVDEPSLRGGWDGQSERRCLEGGW